MTNKEVSLISVRCGGVTLLYQGNDMAQRTRFFEKESADARFVIPLSEKETLGLWKLA